MWALLVKGVGDALVELFKINVRAFYFILFLISILLIIFLVSRGPARAFFFHRGEGICLCVIVRV